MKRVLVTGARGFVGQSLVRALALAPTNLDILRRAAGLLRTMGRLDEGIALQVGDCLPEEVLEPHG